MSQNAAERWLDVRAVRIGLLVLLCVQFAVLGMIQAWSDSLTFDESPDLSIGLTALVHRDLRLVPEHPALGPTLAALPALLAGPDVPRGEAWDHNRSFDYSDELVTRQSERGDLRVVLFLARLVPIALGIACGLLLYRLATRLTDWRGGLLAAGLWLTTPIVLGYSHLDGLDIPFTFAVLLVVAALERHHRSPSVRAAVGVGAALGLALLARHTGLVLVPIAGGLVVWHLRHDRAASIRAAAAVLIIPLVLVWGFYRSVDPSGPQGEVAADFHNRIAAASASSPLADIVLAVPFPLEYRAGFAQLINAEPDRPAYLFGQVWEGSEWWFFPGSAIAKVPATALLAVAAGGLLWRRRDGSSRSRLGWCLAPGAVLGLVLLVQPLNLGLRYALPVLALMMLLAAPLALARGRFPAVLLGVVIAGQLLSVAAAGNHSIAWSPPPFGSAYQAVSDGNLDLGQGQRELAAWAKGKDVRFAVIRPRGMPPLGPELDPTDPSLRDTWVAVGASALTVYQRDALSWLRAYCPVELLAGGSVLVYRFDGEVDLGSGPDRPAAPCTGLPYSLRSG